MRNWRGWLAASSLALVSAKNDVDVGSIFGFILVGLVVGLLARLMVPGRDPLGLIGTIVLGMVGALIGGWAAGAIFRETEGVDWIASVAAAILLILLVRSASGRSRLGARRWGGR